jgi:hypothetical protein
MWANQLAISYGEYTLTDNNVAYDTADTAKNTSFYANSLLMSTRLIRNITAFTFWDLYLAAQTPLKNPDTYGTSYQNLYSEGWVTYGKDFSRYMRVSCGLKISYAQTTFFVRTPIQLSYSGSDAWLRTSMVYSKPFGYRTLVAWTGTLNNDLNKQNVAGKEYPALTHAKLESNLSISYKLAKRFSLTFNSALAWDSTVTTPTIPVFRYETINLVYDLLYSGGSTY